MKRKGMKSDPGCNAHCRAIREEVHHLLDGRLSAPRREALRRHLADCKPCFTAVEFASVLKRLVRERVCRESCPGGLLRRIRGALWSPKALKNA